MSSTLSFLPPKLTSTGSTGDRSTTPTASSLTSLLSYFNDERSSSSSLPLEKSLRHVLQGDEATTNDVPITTITIPRIVGHRGSLYRELENTRAGFQVCAQMGCDAVELDVFALKCGTVVVFHGDGTDENPGLLHDCCQVQGCILDYTYQEALEQLSFNPNHEEFVCPAESVLRGSIPTLEQVLEDVKESGMSVKIELKGKGTVEPTLEVVERLGMMNQCSYASFDLERLRQFRALRPDRAQYPTGALFNSHVPDDYLRRATECGATEIHLKYDTCTRSRVQEIHAAGFGSMLWMRGPVGMAKDCTNKYWDVGNEDESMYLALMKTGVQQMCVNRPDVLVDWRNRHYGNNTTTIDRKLNTCSTEWNVLSMTPRFR